MRWRISTTPANLKIRMANISGYKVKLSDRGNMAKSFEHDPQKESILANRKKGLGIAFE